MAKVKSPEKTHYELLYIIPNKFTEDEAREIDKKVRKIITDNEGEVTYSEEWGKKKLAYLIKGFNHGYYNLLEFDLWGKDLKGVDTSLRMFSEVLRHQIVKGARRTEEEIKKEKEKSKELADKKKEETMPKESEKDFDLIGDAKARERKRSSKKKATLKDLDKKLDDILKTDDLL